MRGKKQLSESQSSDMWGQRGEDHLLDHHQHDVHSPSQQLTQGAVRVNVNLHLKIAIIIT